MSALNTDRLILRPQRASDAAVIHRLWTERDARVPPHRQIGPDGHPTEDDIARRIVEESTSSTSGLLAVERRDIGDVIGYCGLVFEGSGSLDEPELAFELLRAVHNRGYATEAGRAVVDGAVAAGHRRLWASVWDWNVASRRVLQKLGFRETGPAGPEGVHGRTLLTVRELDPS